jgi:formamidopyrimidine-DNA glycosylase
MPELPDIVVYCEALQRFAAGHIIQQVRVRSPFVVRSVDPPIHVIEGLEIRDARRIGKRIVLGLEGDHYLVFHLMITGRLRWKQRGVTVPKKRGLAALDFAHGSLLMTEASTQQRAAIHVLRGSPALAEHDPGGLEVLEADLEAFAQAVTRERHTLKRTLTDPRILSRIGNAYSDEILHAARLSPFQLSTNLDEEDIERLFHAIRGTLTAWTDRLRAEVGGGFPDKVTAFRAGMAVHGRHREPCPVCGSPVQRIRYAQNEANYCATCQTGGRVLADRALSRLLKDDWPRSLEEWEAMMGPR